MFSSYVVISIIYFFNYVRDMFVVASWLINVDQISACTKEEKKKTD